MTKRIKLAMWLAYSAGYVRALQEVNHIRALESETLTQSFNKYMETLPLKTLRLLEKKVTS